MEFQNSFEGPSLVLVSRPSTSKLPPKHPWKPQEKVHTARGLRSPIQHSCSSCSGTGTPWLQYLPYMYWHTRTAVDTTGSRDPYHGSNGR